MSSATKQNAHCPGCGWNSRPIKDIFRFPKTCPKCGKGALSIRIIEKKQ